MEEIESLVTTPISESETDREKDECLNHFDEKEAEKDVEGEVLVKEESTDEHEKNRTLFLGEAFSNRFILLLSLNVYTLMICFNLILPLNPFHV